MKIRMIRYFNGNNIIEDLKAVKVGWQAFKDLLCLIKIYFDRQVNAKKTIIENLPQYKRRSASFQYLKTILIANSNSQLEVIIIEKLY